MVGDTAGQSEPKQWSAKCETMLNQGWSSDAPRWVNGMPKPDFLDLSHLKWTNSSWIGSCLISYTNTCSDHKFCFVPWMIIWGELSGIAFNKNKTWVVFNSPQLFRTCEKSLQRLNHSQRSLQHVQGTSWFTRHGSSAVNKLEMLAWSGEGYKSSLGKLTNISTHHISSLKASIRGWEFLSKPKHKV